MCWAIDLQLKWPSVCVCEIRAEHLWYFSTIAVPPFVPQGFSLLCNSPSSSHTHKLLIPPCKRHCYAPMAHGKAEYWDFEWPAGHTEHCTKEHTSMKALPDCTSLGLSTHRATDFCSILFQRAFFMPSRIRSICLLWFLKGHLFPGIEIWSSILL